MIITVLTEQGTRRCPICGSTTIQDIDHNKVKCMNCNTTMKKEFNSKDIRTILKVIHTGTEDEKIGVSYILANGLKTHPKLTEQHLQDIEELLTSNIPEIRANMAAIIGYTAETHPSSVITALPKLKPLIKDDNEQVRKNAAGALLYFSKTYPDKIPIEQVVQMIDRTEEPFNLIGILGSVAKSNPKKILPHKDIILKTINTQTPPTLYNALNALAQITKHDPSPALTIKHTLKKMLSNQDPKIRLLTTAIFAFIAEKEPDQIEDLRTELERLTNDENQDVKENAKEALNNLT